MRVWSITAERQPAVIVSVFRLHRMHEMQTIVTDVRGVCLSISLSAMWLELSGCVQCVPHAVCTGSFGAAFTK